jgi:serine/threonine protein kinase
MRKAKNKEVNIVSSKDQLKVILDVLGYQDEDDTAFITQDSVLDYHKSLSTLPIKCKFKDMFPLTSDPLLNILKGLLEYNPAFRITAQEALRNPIFDDIRDPVLERPANI